MSDNYFADLASLDCSEHMEKKGKFSYLSWAWAVDKLRRKDPTATWEVMRFNGMPYMKTDCGYFVEVAVTVQGITLSQIHPVLDNNNKPIAQPNSFQINTSIQRCLVKAIALHGLGLYIYAGEDLPDTTEQDAEADAKITEQMKIKWEVLAGSLDGFDQWVDGMKKKNHTLQQMHEVLAKKLLEKNKEVKESA